jgi:hypothetical protein
MVNPGFQIANFWRDLIRTWENMPSMPFARLLIRYVQAMPMARARAFGASDNAGPIMQKAWKDLLAAEQAGILGVTFNDINIGREVQDTEIEEILAKHGLIGFETDKVHPILRPFAAVINTIREVGDFIETLPKAAMIIEYRGDGSIADIGPELRSRIRRMAGSPDFLAKGTATPISNNVMLFSNAMVQGYRSDWEAGTDPKSRSGFWWKKAAMNLLPKLLLLAAGYGLFGERLKRLTKGVTEYDKTNYVIVPLSSDDNGNVMYLRLPQDEPGRFLGGIFWKAMKLVTGSDEKDLMAGLAQLVDYSGGQFPTVTPTLSTLSNVGTYASGRNPYDSFRSKSVLTDDEQKARGWPALKKFIGWEFQQLGGGVVWKFYPGEERPATTTTATARVSRP